LSLCLFMLVNMRQVEFWFWMMADQWGRRRKSPCRYTEADALARDPGATRIEGTCEVRLCPETRDEVSAMALDTGGFMRESRARMMRDG
jgi:hypothetical protein